MDITLAISTLLTNHNLFSTLSPEIINSGRCENFALEVKQHIEGAEVIWDYMWIECTDPICEGMHKVSHCFIKYKDKYYDAECPNGVNHPIQLPFFENQIKP